MSLRCPRNSKLCLATANESSNFALLALGAAKIYNTVTQRIFSNTETEIDKLSLKMRTFLSSQIFQIIDLIRSSPISFIELDKLGLQIPHSSGIEFGGYGKLKLCMKKCQIRAAKEH